MDNKPLDQDQPGNQPDLGENLNSQENQPFQDCTMDGQNQECWPKPENVLQDIPGNQQDDNGIYQNHLDYQQGTQNNTDYRQEMQNHTGCLQEDNGYQSNSGYQQGVNGGPQGNEGYSQNNQGYYHADSGYNQSNQIPPNQYSQFYGQDGQQWNGNQINYSIPSGGNGMSTASMILGIISIVTSCCCCIGIVLGGMGLMFGCLSKVDVNYNPKAKAGIITSVIGIILSVVSIIIWFGISLAGEGGLGFLDTTVMLQNLLPGGFI